MFGDRSARLDFHAKSDALDYGFKHFHFTHTHTNIYSLQDLQTVTQGQTERRDERDSRGEEEGSYIFNRVFLFLGAK